MSQPVLTLVQSVTGENAPSHNSNLLAHMEQALSNYTAPTVPIEIVREMAKGWRKTQQTLDEMTALAAEFKENWEASQEQINRGRKAKP